MTSVAFIIVTYNCREQIAATLEAVVAELEAADELIVVDNDSSDGTPAEVSRAAPSARLIETGGNPGFGAACNAGARASQAELLVFLNPDAVPQPGFRRAIAAPMELADGPEWAGWMGLVTQEAGRLVNTDGGVVHYTGIAWAGGAGEELATRALPTGEPGFISGAAMALPRRRFDEIGGFSEPLFLYHEDVDISLRLRLRGGRLGVAREALVDHAYEFHKGPAKWRYLERNRIATLIRTYPAALLVALLPALALTELVLLVFAAVAGWLPQKLGAYLDTLRGFPRLIGERRRIQSARTIAAGEFAAPLVAGLDSPFLGRAAESKLIGAGLRAYWSLVVRLLGSRS